MQLLWAFSIMALKNWSLAMETLDWKMGEFAIYQNYYYYDYYDDDYYYYYYYYYYHYHQDPEDDS